MPMIGPAQLHEARPQQTELERQHRARHGADGKQRSLLPFAQRFASWRYTASPVRRQRHSASTISSGIAMPISANTMWKPSDSAIWVRAAKRSVMTAINRDPVRFARRALTRSLRFEMPPFHRSTTMGSHVSGGDRPSDGDRPRSRFSARRRHRGHERARSSAPTAARRTRSALDPGSGIRFRSYVEDCQVCCQP